MPLTRIIFAIFVLLAFLGCSTPSGGTGGTGGTENSPLVTVLAVDGTLSSGTLEKKSDVISFSFQAVQGGEYSLKIEDYYTTGKSWSATVKASLAAPDGSAVTGIVSLPSSSSPKKFIAAAAGKYVLTVVAAYTSSLGTFAVGVTYNAPLAAKTDGTRVQTTLASGDTRWVAVPVTAGKTYAVRWWDYDSNLRPNSADVLVSAYHTDGATPYFSAVDAGAATPQIFLAAESGTILLKSSLKYSFYPGALELEVTEGQDLVTGAATTQTLVAGHLVVLTFPCVVGTDYLISFQDAAANTGTQSYGTTSVWGSAYLPADAYPKFSNMGGGSTGTYQALSPTLAGKIVLTFRGATEASFGTFTLKAAPLPAPATLVLGEELATTFDQGEYRWYSFDAQAGKAYQIWWKDGTTFSNSSSAFQADVKVYHGDKSTQFAYGTPVGFANPLILRIPSSETVWIKARQYQNTGSFVLRAAEALAEPAVDLTNHLNEWQSGDYQGGGLWYTVNANAGDSFDVAWQTKGYNGGGASTPTGSVDVSGYENDGVTYLQMAGTNMDRESSYYGYGADLGYHQVTATQTGKLRFLLGTSDFYFFGTYKFLVRAHTP